MADTAPYLYPRDAQFSGEPPKRMRLGEAVEKVECCRCQRGAYRSMYVCMYIRSVCMWMVCTSIGHCYPHTPLLLHNSGCAMKHVRIGLGLVVRLGARTYLTTGKSRSPGERKTVEV